ncbi:MAG: hypothetical protein A3I68_02205 [Candidatus Melainabacteria bacterium RIFCSPLOWO2_02_FULL_35_15]|nr:MAG: hypothetical protein A3F80_03530 [Candidatus Melainabacteria bacterium RIFCSPLOWO2_12_FULL_35_11]OGI13222.1 MAG: hypothetical protein A3I68_02205 [Candidatus Melainabacteria bacterium RIFCSPLOWO2_02_FULL_35_15]
MFTIDLTGKTVAITGASQGIGEAIAEVFAESNAEVILLSRNESKLKAKSQKLKAKYFVLNVSKPENVSEVFNQIDRVDILINNAGVHWNDTVENTDINKWKELLEINLNGVFCCSKAVVGKMKKNKYGRIINMASVCGKVGYAFSGAYNASKFALIGLTQTMAQEVARENITVNAICPGWTETAMAEEILHDEKYATYHNIPFGELKTSCIEAVPIGRYIHPKEVACLALYLASDYASAITGQSINICGGLCMH